MGLIPAGCWLSASPLRFCVALSPSVYWQALLYCCSFYDFFFLGFRQWRSRADRVLTLNMNIWIPLLSSTFSRARGPDSATCAGLAYGRDIAIVEPLSKNHKRCLAIVFPWIVEDTWNQWPTVRVFQISPPRLASIYLFPEQIFLNWSIKMKGCFAVHNMFYRTKSSPI